MSNQLIYQIDNKVFTTGKSVFTFYKSFTLPTLWLRADAGITKDMDNKVSQWQDQSGNNYHPEQQTDFNQPLWVENGFNGKPVLRFSGNQWLKKGFGFEMPQPNTAFVVWSYNSTPGVSPGPFGNFSTRFNYIGLRNSDTLLAMYAGAYMGYTKSASFSELLTTAEFNGTQSKIYENGAFRNVGNAGSATRNGVTIGALYNNSSRLNGDIAEIIFYNSLLSDGQRESVEQYLINKYGLI